MGSNVFANGREVSSKSAGGKAPACFPDVCMTPPENPATPPGVPVPYPNTGMASDTTKGSRNVKVKNKEVMLKNKSYFKKSMGDEAGSAAKKGVVTSVNRGKVYFNSWSMDVKVEGENVVRHLDLTTHNHGSVPGNTPTWPYVDSMNVAAQEACAEDKAMEEAMCEDYQPNNPDGPDPCDDVAYTGNKSKMTNEEAASMRSAAKANDCLTARKCELQPYKATGKQKGCCQGQTPHHIVEKSSFTVIEQVEDGPNPKHKLAAGNSKAEKYKPNDAPCVCAEGPSWHKGSHAEMHTIQGWLNSGDTDPNQPLVTTTEEDGEPVSILADAITYKDARDNGATAMSEVFPESACSEECLKAQLDAYHKDKCGVKDDDKINAVMAGNTGDADAQSVLDGIGTTNNDHPPTGM